MNVAPPDLRVRLLGYCALDADALTRAFAAGGPSALSDLEGEYVVVVESAAGGTTLIGSRHGVMQYYYALCDGRFFHGDTVAGVVRQAGFGWSWNWVALGDLLSVGNLLENETLHPRVHRVPAGGIVHFRAGRLSCTAGRKGPDPGPVAAGPEEALDAFNAEVRRWMTPRSAVSISGGLDSRAILSAFVQAGASPRLLVMGFDDSTDVVAARTIAERLRLDLVRVELGLPDYLEHASSIAWLSNGTALAHDWHSYIYLRKSGLPSDTDMFLGSNGEFARSFGCDREGPARVAQALAPASVPLVWRLRMSRAAVLAPAELASLHPGLAAELGPGGRARRASRLAGLSHRSILPGLSRYYLEQRVRHAMGNGVKLCQASMACRLPFLGSRWVGAASRMGQEWKFASRWHRHAIGRNCPALAVPPGHARAGFVPYHRCREWFADDRVAGWVEDRRDLLTGLMRPGLVGSILAEHRARRTRTAAVAFLVGMAAWMDVLRSVRGAGR